MSNKISFLLMLMLITGMQLGATENDRPKPGARTSIEVYPEVILPGSPVMVVMVYTSSDGCPDFELVKDSVVQNKLYIGVKDIKDTTKVCTQAFRQFKTVLQLGVLAQGTEIYVDGKLMRTVKYECHPNRLGVVVEGRSTCEGRLLVQDRTSIASVMMLYALPAGDESTAEPLKAGDQIRFMATTAKRDTTGTDSCKVVGVVICYQRIQPVPAFTLSGIALAGADTLLYGRVILINKNRPHAVATTAIVNGKYVFANVPKGEYTVFVSPDRQFYRRFLPTFYVDKLRIKEAEYVSLDADISSVNVVLATMATRPGKGRIDGRVTYENEKLRDSVYSKRPSYIPAAEAAYDVTVLLVDRANKVVAWTTTDDNGKYSFDGISTEGYKVVCETTSADAGSDVTLSSAYPVATVDLVLKAPSEVTSTNALMVNILSLSPTVITDVLNVVLTEAAELRIFTLLGQQVMSLQLDAGSHSVDAGLLPKGVLLLTTPGETHKLIKR